ncbi:MAG: endonuclease/exonuclease/phosphatase family protein [Patescibacteria group bacterium]|nr:endonuclease/exonuclease/phosphatase family protein [Patescibacteria group bacterium]
MLYRNRELERAFGFIRDADFDLFCLQEVPDGFRKRLETLPYFIAARTDVERLFARRTEYNSVMILSKHPIASEGEIPFPDYEPLLPLRTRIFVRLMRPFGFSRVRNRGGVFADVLVPGAPRSVRVFNLHLILAHPRARIVEFEAALAKRNPEQPTVLCGDFNILETPHITPLNWMLGGRMSDAVFYRRERSHIEKRLVEHELRNTLRGHITHPLSRSQLDHILVSRDFRIENAEVIPDRIGSDHHPIRVEAT